MAAHFHATQSGYSWMASSYLLANASCVPFWGKLSDIFGRKPVIILANIVFLVGSLICALSTSLAMNIAGRSIQGAGGGGIIVLANITVSDIVSVRYVLDFQSMAYERIERLMLYLENDLYIMVFSV